MNVIIYENAYYKSENTIFQRNKLLECLKARNIDAVVISSHTDYLKLNVKADFCIFLDKDISTAKTLETDGIKVFNSSSAIASSDSKMLTYALCKDICFQPLSIFSPLRYSYDCLKEDYLNYIREHVGYPLVLKVDKSSLGKEVYLVDNEQKLIDLDKTLYDKRYIVQKYIKESFGKSIRAIVIGFKVVCFLKYENVNDFRSNKEQGGICTKVEMPKNFISLAEKIAKELNLFYCGIDFFDLIEPMLIEVNSNAFFTGAFNTYNINLADILIDRIIESH